jgi:hypothetical protein
VPAPGAPPPPPPPSPRLQLLHAPAFVEARAERGSVGMAQHALLVLAFFAVLAQAALPPAAGPFLPLGGLAAAGAPGAHAPAPAVVPPRRRHGPPATVIPDEREPTLLHNSAGSRPAVLGASVVVVLGAAAACLF